MRGGRTTYYYLPLTSRIDGAGRHAVADFPGLVLAPAMGADHRWLAHLPLARVVALQAMNPG
jgi:hypothetical protein